MAGERRPQKRPNASALLSIVASAQRTNARMDRDMFIGAEQEFRRVGGHGRIVLPDLAAEASRVQADAVQASAGRAALSSKKNAPEVDDMASARQGQVRAATLKDARLASTGSDRTRRATARSRSRSRSPHHDVQRVAFGRRACQGSQHRSEAPSDERQSVASAPPKRGRGL
mmetsp:Transcript_63075/g.150329  ORF Transcript_63075/g.150329 Transcript_63075/m.150329 type:complete len:172 (+) Transcript_63075:107-622(+)